MAEETKADAEEQVADPYHANALGLATQAISAVGNVITMVSNSGNIEALGFFVILLKAQTEVLWDYAKKTMPPEALKETEKVIEQTKKTMTTELNKIIAAQETESSIGQN